MYISVCKGDACRCVFLCVKEVRVHACTCVFLCVKERRVGVSVVLVESGHVYTRELVYVKL